MVQFQFFGRGNTQINQEVFQSLPALLINMSDALKTRGFASDEVRDQLFVCIDEVTQLLNDNHENLYDCSKYMVFPFKMISKPEYLQDQSYILSMLDTLSVIALMDHEFEVRDNYINVKIADKYIYGIYYTTGRLNLVDSYSRLLKNMADKSITLPNGFVCIPLDTSGAYTLEETKINNIVTDIVGDRAYIKPLQIGTPKCISLSSYIISEAQNLEEAQAHVMEVLGLE